MTGSAPDGPSADANATIWTMIRGAAGGDEGRRTAFAERYLPLVRGYLGRRWGGSNLAAEVDDGVQEVFVECLRPGGVLERAEADRPGGFRAYFLGVVRNVARRREDARGTAARVRTETAMPADVEAEERQLGRELDREWARCLVRQAADHHRRTALARGAAARQEVELLRLRFEEGLPIRAIAERWGEEPAAVHRRYRQARSAFRSSLRKVVAFHQPGAADLDRECERLLGLLAED